MKTAVMIIIFIGFAIAARHRKREQQRTYRAVADELGLQIDGHSFRGQLGQYQIETRQVRRRVSRYSTVGAKVLELELHSAPRDMVFDRESISSTIARAAGLKDLEVGDAEFDGLFRISSADESTAREWLGNAPRRGALIELNELVDRIEIEDGWLEVEIPTDPFEQHEIRELLEWFVEVAGRIDAPRAGTLPPLNLRVRERRSKWRPLMLFAAMVLPLVVVAGLFAGLFWKLGMFKPREPRTEIGVWSRNYGMSIPKKQAFIDCVQGTPKSPDVDFSECEKLGLDVNLAFSEVRDAYFVMRAVQVRRAARVDLDPEGVEKLIETIVRQTEGARDHEQFVRDDVVPLFLESGMHQEFRARAENADEVSLSLQNLEVLYTGALPFAADLTSSRSDWALHCLDGGQPAMARSQSLVEARIACGGEWRQRDLVGSEVIIAALELDAKKADEILARGSLVLEPEAALALYVHQQTATEPSATAAVDPVATAAELQPPECLTPWTPTRAFGEPDALLRVADQGGALADRLRLFAARQYAVQGRGLTAAKVLLPMESERDAICAAQLETALGKPADALARLGAIESTHGGLRPLAAAYAHAVAGDWDDAYARAQEALAELPTSEGRHAEILMAAAALKLGRADGLDDKLGPVGDVSELKDAVDVSRWYGAAARDEGDNATDRWIAPSMPLLQGSEPLQFMLAAELADDDQDAELWLDIVMPGEFDPLGVPVARRFAAEQRGDEQAAAWWRKLEEGHLERVRDASDARLYRIARSNSQL